MLPPNYSYQDIPRYPKYGWTATNIRMTPPRYPKYGWTATNMDSSSFQLSSDPNRTCFMLHRCQRPCLSRCSSANFSRLRRCVVPPETMGGDQGGYPTSFAKWCRNGGYSISHRIRMYAIYTYMDIYGLPFTININPSHVSIYTIHGSVMGMVGIPDTEYSILMLVYGRPSGACFMQLQIRSYIYVFFG